MFNAFEDTWFWCSIWSFILMLEFDTWFWCLILTLDFDTWFWCLILMDEFDDKLVSQMDVQDGCTDNINSRVASRLKNSFSFFTFLSFKQNYPFLHLHSDIDSHQSNIRDHKNISKRYILDFWDVEATWQFKGSFQKWSAKNIWTPP